MKKNRKNCNIPQHERYDVTPDKFRGYPKWARVILAIFHYSFFELLLTILTVGFFVWLILNFSCECGNIKVAPTMEIKISEQLPIEE